jgi:hypothetical protein
MPGHWRLDRGPLWQRLGTRLVTLIDEQVLRTVSAFRPSGRSRRDCRCPVRPPPPPTSMPRPKAGSRGQGASSWTGRRSDHHRSAAGDLAGHRRALPARALPARDRRCWSRRPATRDRSRTSGGSGCELCPCRPTLRVPIRARRRLAARSRPASVDLGAPLLARAATDQGVQVMPAAAGLVDDPARACDHPDGRHFPVIWPACDLASL